LKGAKAPSATSSVGCAARRARLFSIAAAVAALGSLALALAPAAAGVVHSVEGPNFGPDGTSATSFGTGIRAIAFDNSRDRLYVESNTPTTPKIYGFDVSTPGTYTPLTGNFPIDVGAGGTDGLTVDNVSGNIYYSTNGAAGTVSGFDSTGAELGGNFPFSPTWSGQKSLCGSGVDPDGTIWAGNFFSTQVNRYSPEGAFVDTADATPSHQPCGFVFDQSTRDLYVISNAYGLYRYTASSGYGTYNQLTTGGGGVAVNSSTHDVFTAGSPNFLTEQDPDGNVIEQVITSGASWRGVAVDDATDDVYLTDSNNGGKVRVFPSTNTPDAIADPVSNLTRTTATLNGHVDPLGAGDVTTCHFDYGTTTGYALGPVACLDGSDTVVGTVGNPITGPAAVHADLSSLTPDTTYDFRLVAANASFTTNGKNAVFKTPIAVGGVTALPATDLTKFSATLNGTYNGDGGDVQYYFEWGPDTNYGQTTATPPGPSNGIGTGPQNVSEGLTGLNANTVYHYRLVAHNSFGDNFSSDKTFTTAPPDLPVVDGTSVSGVTQDGATFNSEIKPGFGPTIYRFQYGPTSSYGSATFPGGPTAYDNIDHAVSEAVSGLSPRTTYHFRVQATNFAGTAYGPDQEFTTLSAPIVGSPSASAIAQTSATLGAVINPSLSSTTYHFEYGTSSSYGAGTVESGSLGSDNSAHPVAAGITGLTPGTTYHYRVVAANAVGPTASSDQTFTTAAAPLIISQVTCKRGFVKRHGSCVKRHRRHHKRGGRNG
jgi:hypothetical protein